jgi:hypothetical protein
MYLTSCLPLALGMSHLFKNCITAVLLSARSVSTAVIYANQERRRTAETPLDDGFVSALPLTFDFCP